jgi:dihydropteroate synthase
MGIVNVTPDSFYPAARTHARAAAIARGRALFDQGCDVVDVGGESTRPGAEHVDVTEELARVVAVVEALSPFGPVSIDTTKRDVAIAAVDAGAMIINDVSSSLLEVAGQRGVGYVAMHAKGDSKTMQVNPTYDDVVSEVATFLEDMARNAQAMGVSPCWIDPGIGFGKTIEHNLALLAHCDRFVEIGARYGVGVLVGTSRKRFLGHLGNDVLSVDERLEGSMATAAWAMLEGVSMVRVHDAAEALLLRELMVRPLEEVHA